MTDDQQRRDLAAIERLHQRDMAASKAQDFAVLRTLMDDDAVVLAPGAKPVRGRAALDSNFARQSGAAPAIEVTDYRFDWNEIEIVGDYAIEWGRIIGAFRPKDGGETTAAVYNVLRVLKRQRGDDWRVYRTIWNEAPAKG